MFLILKNLCFFVFFNNKVKPPFIGDFLQESLSLARTTPSTRYVLSSYYERKRKQNVEDLGSSSFSIALWGSYEAEERKEETGREKLDGGGGAKNTRVKTRRGSCGYL